MSLAGLFGKVTARPISEDERRWYARTIAGAICGDVRLTLSDAGRLIACCAAAKGAEWPAQYVAEELRTLSPVAANTLRDALER